MYVLFGVPADTVPFIEGIIAELRPPESLLERNVVQIQITERVLRNFDVDRLDALVTVAQAYARKFPHQQPT